MSADLSQPYQVLFTRQDVEAIANRFAHKILHREMTYDLAWKQAVEDQAQVVEYKLVLMEEGALEWDYPSKQLKAMRERLESIDQFQ